jgi:RNA polymerase sigma-70 factor (ECF subfamily)
MATSSPLEKKFIELYEANSDAIFRHCFFRVFNRDKAKEIMQEAFTKTWGEIANGKDIKNLKAFIYQVANNLIIDDARKKKEMSLETMQETTGFDPGAEDPLLSHRLLDAKQAVSVIQKIEQPYREAILMRYIDELSPRDIAKITGETTDVISVRIHRGIKKLRLLLKEYEKNN